jgi:hypothetical protein
VRLDNQFVAMNEAILDELRKVADGDKIALKVNKKGWVRFFIIILNAGVCVRRTEYRRTISL